MWKSTMAHEGGLQDGQVTASHISLSLSLSASIVLICGLVVISEVYRELYIQKCCCGIKAFSRTEWLMLLFNRVTAINKQKTHKIPIMHLFLVISLMPPVCNKIKTFEERYCDPRILESYKCTLDIVLDNKTSSVTCNLNSSKFPQQTFEPL